MKTLLPTRQRLLLTLSTLTAVSLLSATATADQQRLAADTGTIVIPIGQQAAGQAIATPVTGMSMANVEARFGAPVQRFAATGEPPITRWEYDRFVVYFEDDKVIHSVVRFKPLNEPS